MSIVAIIPARGGSKGIHKKNIVPLCGKPLIAWTIEQALASRLIDEVIVSTDCALISEVSKHYGANVVIRPSHLSGDYSTTESAVFNVFSQIDNHESVTVLLQATSPIRQPGDIDNCIQMILDEDVDSVFSGRHCEGHIWMQGNELQAIETDRKMRQKRSLFGVEENGSIYAFKTDKFLEEKNRLCGEISCYLMHELDSLQIDTPEDLQTMEQLMPLRLNECLDVRCLSTGAI